MTIVPGLIEPREDRGSTGEETKPSGTVEDITAEGMSELSASAAEGILSEHM